MTKKDKDGSIFGKLLGGNKPRAEEEEPVETVYGLAAEASMEELGEEDVVAEEIQELETAEAGMVPEAVRPDPVGKPMAPREASQHEEWLSDYEGQLNIDMYQTKDNVIIKSTIAGVRPEDMDITVANDMLTIKGARRREENISEDDYFYQECYWGNFSRSVIIPVDIDSEHIEADLKDGILTVVVPKAAKAKTKKIKVKGM